MLDFSDSNFSHASTIRGPTLSCWRCLGLISEILRISSSSSFNYENENSTKVSVLSSKVLLSSVILKIELYTSKLVDPIIQGLSIETGGSKKKVLV